MSIIEILKSYTNESGEFNDLFIQMFVGKDNKFNFSDFNRVHESHFTHKQILEAIKDLTGSKVVKYCDPEPDVHLYEIFKGEYSFGKFKHARDWNIYLFENYGKVLMCSLILGWIAKQYPKPVKSSFLPTNDGNLYAKEEYLPSAD